MIFDPSHSSVHGIFSRNGRVSVRKTYSRCTQFWLCQKVAIIANAKQPNTTKQNNQNHKHRENTHHLPAPFRTCIYFRHLICSIVVLDVDIMYLCWMCTLCCRIQLKIAICQRKYPRLVDELICQMKFAPMENGLFPFAQFHELRNLRIICRSHRNTRVPYGNISNNYDIYSSSR